MLSFLAFPCLFPSLGWICVTSVEPFFRDCVTFYFSFFLELPYCQLIAADTGECRSQAMLAVAQQQGPWQDAAIYGGARRLYMQRAATGYGFLFSSAASTTDSGISHCVTKVDEQSP